MRLYVRGVVVLRLGDEVRDRRILNLLKLLLPGCQLALFLFLVFLGEPVGARLQQRVNELIHLEYLIALYIEQQRLLVEHLDGPAQLVLHELDNHSDHVGAHQQALLARLLARFVVALRRLEGLPGIQLLGVLAAKVVDAGPREMIPYTHVEEVLEPFQCLVTRLALELDRVRDQDELFEDGFDGRQLLQELRLGQNGEQARHPLLRQLKNGLLKTLKIVQSQQLRYLVGLAAPSELLHGRVLRQGRDLCVLFPLLAVEVSCAIRHLSQVLHGLQFLSERCHAVAGERVLGDDVDLENATPFLSLDGVHDEHKRRDWHAHVQLECAIVRTDGHAALICWVQPDLHEVRVMQVIAPVYLNAAPVIRAVVCTLDTPELVRLAALRIGWLRPRRGVDASQDLLLDLLSLRPRVQERVGRNIDPRHDRPVPVLFHPHLAHVYCIIVQYVVLRIAGARQDVLLVVGSFVLQVDEVLGQQVQHQLPQVVLVLRKAHHRHARH